MLEKTLRVHCTESTQTLYALPSLKKSGVMEGELVMVHSSLIHSGVEHASPVWANLSEHFSLVIEGVQKKP